MASIKQFGIDLGIYGSLAQPKTIIELAKFSEKVGFDSIWLADHVVFPSEINSKYPYSADGSFPAPLTEPLMEPLATMGVLVGVTESIKIGTAVLIIPYRNPVLLSRMLVTMDQFSEGRIILGAGVGWLEEEFQVMKTYDFEKRGIVTDEYIEIFKRLSKGGEISFDGQTYEFPKIYSIPGSHQKPHPPILIGGIANPALRRVVKHGDGWLAVAIDKERMTERLNTLKRICDENDRKFEDLELVYKIFVNPGEPQKGPFGDREIGSGSEQQIIQDIQSAIDSGFSKIVVRYRGDSSKEQMVQIERFADTIIPNL